MNHVGAVSVKAKVHHKNHHKRDHKRHANKRNHKQNQKQNRRRPEAEPHAQHKRATSDTTSIPPENYQDTTRDTFLLGMMHDNR